MRPRRHVLYGIAPGVVIGVIVGVIVALVTTWWLGVLVALIAAAATAWWILWSAHRSLLARLGAHEVGDDRVGDRLRNVVDGVCLANGIEEPVLWRLDDEALNAGIVAAHDGSVHLVITSGLLEACDVMMLEGIVAQQMSIAADLDVRAITVGSRLSLIGPLSSLRARLVDPLLPDQHRAMADVRGAALTRYPPGLVAALELAEARSVGVRNAEMLEPLWLFATSSTSSGAGDRTTERIAVLREL